MTISRLNDPLAAYPVGSIYMSVNNADPATLFGGTWQRITGRFLLAATDNGSSGASQAAGNTGGEATHKLTANESGVPAHGHGFTDPTYKTSGSDGGHSHTITTKYANIRQSGNLGMPWYGGSNTRTDFSTIASNTGTHGHTISKNSAGSVSDNTASGAANAHNNMPPYLAVYVWKRTA